ncbi:MAG: inositol monophosphatase [Phycisphaerae bacterium]
MITEIEIQQYLQLTIDLACEGGRLAKSLIGKTKSSFKDDKSIVTEADKRVQDRIVERLAKEFPSHGLIAEENTPLAASRPKGDAEFVWTIDPIDGTRNFAKGIHIFCCSIALLHQGRPIVGAIYEPNYEWLFSASVGGPAEFNRLPVQMRPVHFGPETVFGISINTYANRPVILHHLMDYCMLRNLGSTALHLGMTAAGMMDGAIHFGGKLWDIAAGALIVEQAGGIIYPIDKNGLIIKKPLWPLDLKQYNNDALPFVAANACLVDDLQKG